MRQDLYERGREIIQAAPELYVDLDVEADGVPGYGSLRSAGALTPWGDEFHCEIKPTSNLSIPSQDAFCEAHGQERERLLEEGLEPAHAMQGLAEWTLRMQMKYRKLGSVLTAYNASFDFPWINLEMVKAGIDNPYGIAGYCIKSRALELSGKYSWRDTKKSRLPAIIVPEGDFTHNPIEDAHYQQKIHFALVGLLDTAWVKP
ncbi:hypothetical protein KA047_02960 [Candidatus Saccharibacteria bacterium]|nr:hypothetical protein [Candidatus Saccharibacteria bacterium]